MALMDFLSAPENQKKVIDSFRGSYFFLSNFYPARVYYNGISFCTVEHAYQAAKTTSKSYQIRIALAPFPGEAKRLGREGSLRDDWTNAERLRVMEMLLVEKFKERNLGRLLKATGAAKLVEGNNWGDDFWGVCGGRGTNHLGKLLMKIRGKLQPGPIEWWIREK